MVAKGWANFCTLVFFNGKDFYYKAYYSNIIFLIP